jgi:hypothetical protein
LGAIQVEEEEDDLEEALAGAGAAGGGARRQRKRGGGAGGKAKPLRGGALRTEGTLALAQNVLNRLKHGQRLRKLLLPELMAVALKLGIITEDDFRNRHRAGLNKQRLIEMIAHVHPEFRK